MGVRMEKEDKKRRWREKRTELNSSFHSNTGCRTTFKGNLYLFLRPAGWTTQPGLLCKLHKTQQHTRVTQYHMIQVTERC